MENIWFTADLHLHHKNILMHQVNRVDGMSLKSIDDIETHDNYIINMLRSTIKKSDRIYFIGDILFGDRNSAINFLSKIPGSKYFINGNHDAAFNHLDNYFKWKGDIKQVCFKKSSFDFLKKDFEVCMCHYTMLSWPGKSRGALMLHGHTHNNAPNENSGNDLRFNVGIDNPLANFKIFSLEEIYNFYLKKLDGLTPKEYIEKVTKENKNFVR